jgi:hypothetical protein
MQQDLTIAARYQPALASGDAHALLGSAALEVAHEGSLKVTYAPFDHVALNARLVVVGITPGESQALVAIRAQQAALSRGMSLPDALRAAKLTASFSGGVMRSNLIAMLDEIGVARLLGLRSSAELFTPGGELVHLTSALRYPVFVGGKNYNGTPDMIRTPLLRRMIETHLAEEARLLPEALWLPLGPKPAQALRHLAGMGHLDPARILDGLPHPSGANGERVAVFLGRKAPEAASTQTNGANLVASRAHLVAQVRGLTGDAA